MANEPKKEDTKKELASVKEYKKWRNAHYSLKLAPYVTVLVPFGAELGINWSKWFGQGDDGTHISLAMGLVMALISLLLSVLSVAKKDSELMKKVGPYFATGTIFLLWGGTLYFLASIFLDVAELLIWAGVSILVAAVEDAVDNTVVEPNYKFVKKTLEDLGLTKKGEWKLKFKEQAEKDAEERIPTE